MIEHWFSVPIYYIDLEEQEQNLIRSELSKHMSNIESRLGNPWGDTVLTTFKYNGSNLIKDLHLTKLEELVTLNLTRYLGSDYKYTIKESWLNLSQKHGFQFDHQHFGFEFSAVYYYQTNGADGDIIFINPNPYKNFMPVGNQITRYAPKQGRLIIFPAWLTHRVEANQTDHERISLTFNIKLGD